MSSNQGQDLTISGNEVLDIIAELSLGSIPPIVEVSDIKRSPPTKEEKDVMPKAAIAMLTQSANIAYVRTVVGVLLCALMDRVAANSISITDKGHLIFKKGSRMVGVVSAGVVIRHILPLTEATIGAIQNLEPAAFNRFDRKQVSVSDVAFIASSVYHATNTISPRMAVALKIGSFCALKDAVWSLRYEFDTYKKIECYISTSSDKKGEKTTYAFGNRLAKDFVKPRATVTHQPTVAIEEDDFTDSKYDDVEYLFSGQDKSKADKDKSKPDKKPKKQATQRSSSDVPTPAPSTSRGSPSGILTADTETMKDLVNARIAEVAAAKAAAKTAEKKPEPVEDVEDFKEDDDF